MYLLQNCSAWYPSFPSLAGSQLLYLHCHQQTQGKRQGKKLLHNPTLHCFCFHYLPLSKVSFSPTYLTTLNIDSDTLIHYQSVSTLLKCLYMTGLHSIFMRLLSLKTLKNVGQVIGRGSSSISQMTCCPSSTQHSTSSSTSSQEKSSVKASGVWSVADTTEVPQHSQSHPKQVLGQQKTPLYMKY